MHFSKTQKLKKLNFERNWITCSSGHFVCLEMTALLVNMNGLKIDFDGSGVAVNQWMLGLEELKMDT